MSYDFYYTNLLILEYCIVCSVKASGSTLVLDALSTWTLVVRGISKSNQTLLDNRLHCIDMAMKIPFTIGEKSLTFLFSISLGLHEVHLHVVSLLEKNMSDATGKLLWF